MIKEEAYQVVAGAETATYVTDYETERNKPTPSLNHSQVQLNVGTSLRNHYKKDFSIVTEVDLDLPNAQRPTVPDISIFPKRKLHLSSDILKVKEPPLTTIGIISPKQDLDSIKEKIFENYFPAGVKSAWVVVPTTRTVTIYSPDEKFTTYATGQFIDPATGITLSVDDVFEDLE